LRDELGRWAIDLKVPAPPKPADLFTIPVREVWLEIGFGGGEHLLWQSQHHPDVGLIGCEPFQDGVIKALSEIRGGRHSNIRLYPDDARPLLRWLPPASIARAFILFPDPWPKKRHVKRRLINSHLLGLLNAVLSPGSELRVATDDAGYAEAILHATREPESGGWICEVSTDQRRGLSDWPQTRYEAKALAAGRVCHYLRFLRTR
jgi:tRNA (guanine-N7-)-methyltransferase